MNDHQTATTILALEECIEQYIGGILSIMPYYTARWLRFKKIFDRGEV